MNRNHGHYFKDVRKLDTLDVYRVLSLFEVTDPCIQHAIKKLLVAGGRGAGKDICKDVREATDSLQRWQEMRLEETCEELLAAELQVAEDNKAPVGNVSMKPSDVLFETFAVRTGYAATRMIGVRVTHIPSGIKAECHTEGSEHANRAIALQALKVRLELGSRDGGQP